MTDEKGPGLPIIIWSAGKTRKTLSKSLEFDCQGPITVLPSSAFDAKLRRKVRTDGDRARASKGKGRLLLQQVLAQRGEIKASIADKNKTLEPLEIRLRTVHRVLELTLELSVGQFRLLGFVFHSFNGNPDDTVFR